MSKVNRKRRAAALAAAVGMCALAACPAFAAQPRATTAADARFGLSAYNQAGPGSGIGYGYNSGGTIVRYTYTSNDAGTSSWQSAQVLSPGVPNPGATVRQIFTDADGVIFTLDTAGKLTWSGYNGKGGLAPGSGTVIGTGFNRFVMIAYAGGGTFYAVDAAGNLVWYRDTDLDDGGRVSWAYGGIGQVIGHGFSQFSALAAAWGSVYVVGSGSALLGYSYSDPTTPTGTWARNGTAVQVGNGLAGISDLTASPINGLGPGTIAALNGYNAAGVLLLWTDQVVQDNGTVQLSPSTAQVINGTWYQ